MQEEKVTQKMNPKERSILIQLEAQINYFRFVYKIYKKMKNTLKT